MSRKRREEPQGLIGIEPRGHEAAPTILTMERITMASRPAVATAAIATAVEAPGPEPILFVGLGHLKDGRHVAFEAEVEGRKVLRWTPICAKATVDAPERAWWQIHYARLCMRRELTETEQAANARDTVGVTPEHFAHGKAVAIRGTGKSAVALAVSLEGMTVTEPEVITKSTRDWCMVAIGGWAGINMLPRRKL